MYSLTSTNMSFKQIENYNRAVQVQIHLLTHLLCLRTSTNTGYLTRFQLKTWCYSCLRHCYLTKTMKRLIKLGKSVVICVMGECMGKMSHSYKSFLLRTSPARCSIASENMFGREKRSKSIENCTNIV